MSNNHQSLDILRDLRERAGLTQADMARRCGLTGRQSHQTAGAWERGEIKPSAHRRTRFIGYLWDELRLREDPAQFEAIWAILEKEWHWAPISDDEWRAQFPGTPRPGTNDAPATLTPAADDTPTAPTRERSVLPPSTAAPDTTAPHATRPGVSDDGRAHPAPFASVAPLRWLRWSNPVLLTLGTLVLAVLFVIAGRHDKLPPFFGVSGSAVGFPCIDEAHAVDQLVLAVAQFDETPDRNTEARLLDALDAYVKENALEQHGLRVCAVAPVVSSGVEAQRLVQEWQVALLAWGRLDDVVLEIGWQVLEWSQDGTMVAQWPATEAQSFTFQTSELDAAMTPLAGFALSHLLLLQEERAAAIRLLEVLTADEIATVHADLLARSYFFLGYLHMKAGNPTAADWRAALDAFRKGLELAPERTDMLLNVGYLYEQLAEWDAALATYTAAIEAGVDPAAAYYNRARVHLYGDNFTAAALDAEAAIALDPTDWSFYHVLGIAQLGLGRQAAAAATYDQVRCRIDPAQLPTVIDYLESLADELPQRAAVIHATIEHLHSEPVDCSTLLADGT